MPLPLSAVIQQHIQQWHQSAAAVVHLVQSAILYTLLLNTGHSYIIPQSSLVKNGFGSLSVAIQTRYIQSLVSICMFLLHLSLSYGAWDMEIQEMVSHLKSNLPSFSTCVSQVSVSNTLVSIFSDQMRLLQGKFHVSRLDSHTHKFTPDTSKRFAWHFHLKNSTPNMSSCHLHWIPLLSTFDIAKSSGHSLRSALEPSMDPILLHHHLPRIEPMHVTVKDHFHKMSLPSVPSQCDSYIC